MDCLPPRCWTVIDWSSMEASLPSKMAEFTRVTTILLPVLTTPIRASQEWLISAPGAVQGVKRNARAADIAKKDDIYLTPLDWSHYKSLIGFSNQELDRKSTRLN